MKLLIVATLLPFLLSFTAEASGYDGPVVVDHANYLDGKQLVELVNKVEAANAKNDFLLVILTVPSLEGQRVELYAQAVTRSWGIGREDRDDGLLLLVVRDESTAYFYAGKDARQAITAERLDVVKDNVLIPHLRTEEYLEGFLETVDALAYEETGSYVYAALAAIPLALLLIIVFANTLNRKKRICTHCRLPVSAMVSRCPHCLGDLRVGPKEDCPCGSGRPYEDCCLDRHMEGRDSHRIQLLRVLDVRYLMSQSTSFGGYTGGGTGELPARREGQKPFDGIGAEGRF